MKNLKLLTVIMLCSLMTACASSVPQEQSTNQTIICPEKTALDGLSKVFMVANGYIMWDDSGCGL